MFDADNPPIGTAAVARKLGRLNGGRPLSPITVTRWVTKGVYGPGGRRVRLRAVRVGRAWATTERAVNEFIQSLTPRLDLAGV